MAKSKAKKNRLKWIREGKLHPSLKRETWAINPVERKTPTKAEKIRKQERKHSLIKKKVNPEEGLTFFV